LLFESKLFYNEFQNWLPGLMVTQDMGWGQVATIHGYSSLGISRSKYIRLFCTFIYFPVDTSVLVTK